MKVAIFVLLSLFSLNTFAMGTAQLIESIAAKSGLSKADAKRALDGFVQESVVLYMQGEIVPVPGVGIVCGAKEKANKTKCSNRMSSNFTPSTNTLEASFRVYFSNLFHHQLTKSANEIRKEVQDKKNNGIVGGGDDFGDVGDNVNFNPLATGGVHLFVSHFSGAYGQFLMKEDPNQLLKDEKSARHFFDKWMGEFGYAYRSFELAKEFGEAGKKLAYRTTDVTGTISLEEGREMVANSGQTDEILASGQDPIVRNIRKRARLTDDQAEAFLKAFAQTINQALAAGDSVKLGDFGRLFVPARPTDEVVEFRTGNAIKNRHQTASNSIRNIN